MTQEFVTLPREVLEQALEGLIMGFAMYPNGGTTRAAIAAAIKELRAALEQPQVEQKAFAWISPRALEWGTRQSEKVVKLTCKAQPEYDFTEPLYTHPQPQVELEPVAWYDGNKFYGSKAAASMNMANMSVLSPVYLHQPKPLTDEAVLGVAKSIEIQFDSERLNEQIDDILAFAHAIEAAHNIK